MKKQFYYSELIIEKIPKSGLLNSTDYYSIQYRYNSSPKKFYPICLYEDNCKSYGLNSSCYYEHENRKSFKGRCSYINYGTELYCWVVSYDTIEGYVNKNVDLNNKDKDSGNSGSGISISFFTKQKWKKGFI